MSYISQKLFQYNIQYLYQSLLKKSFLNSKIHKATVTDSQIDYEGSCEIDIALLNAAGISVYEKIDIYNNGNIYRDFTYIDHIVKSISLLTLKI